MEAGVVEAFFAFTRTKQSNIVNAEFLVYAIAALNTTKMHLRYYYSSNKFYMRVYGEAYEMICISIL